MNAKRENAYKALKDKHQKEIESFPMGFAFDKQQFSEMMTNFGLAETDTDKIYSIGLGGYIRKDDAKALEEVQTRIIEELRAAIAEDTTGEGFIYDLFLYELNNHEYGYTLELEPTLDAIGFSKEELDSNPALVNGLTKAAKYIRDHRK